MEEVELLKAADNYNPTFISIVTIVAVQLILIFRPIVINWFKVRHAVKARRQAIKMEKEKDNMVNEEHKPEYFDGVRLDAVNICDCLIVPMPDTKLDKRVAVFKLDSYKQVDILCKCFWSFKAELISTAIVYENIVEGSLLFLVFYRGPLVYATKSGLIICIL